MASGAVDKTFAGNCGLADMILHRMGTAATGVVLSYRVSPVSGCCNKAGSGRRIAVTGVTRAAAGSERGNSVHTVMAVARRAAGC